MKARRDSDRKPLAALTLIELLVVIAVIGTLFAVFMPALLDRPVKVPRIKCAYHLKQIGLALRIFANDHHEEEYDFFHRDSRLSAFTRVELAAIIAVAGVLAGLAVCALADAKAKSRGICCNCRLKQIGLAFRIFSSDHGSTFPMRISTNQGGSMEYGSESFRHFQVLSNELSTPKILTCPSDTRKPALDFSALSNANTSYFLGVDAKESSPQVLLAGDRNLMTNDVPVGSGPLELTTNLTVGWTAHMHKNRGYVAFGDGHVDSMSSNRLQEQLINSGVATNRLLVP